jgi:uncharacterized pyridoxamine 5'-phosphate oxidase family protein
MLTGLLFGQDVLITIGGSQAKGKFIEVTEKHIVFQQSGISVPSKIPKMSVARVVLSNGDVAFFMTEEMKNQLKQRKLNAQIELRDLVLKKNDKIVTIPKGDWVVAVNVDKAEILGVLYTFNPDVYAGGELLGISGDGILIRESGKDKERNIPFNEIGILYHGYYPKEISKYILDGVKWGCILPAALFRVTINSSTNLEETLPLYFNFAVLTISGGALLGFIHGKKIESDTIEYVISPNDWQINLRDISN